MRELKYNKILLIMFIFFVFSINLKSEIPELKVIVSDNALCYFSKNDKKILKYIIKARLNEEFKLAWEILEAKKGELPQCYQEAFENYKTYLKDRKKNIFEIEFTLDGPFILFLFTTEEGKKLYPLTKETFKGDRYGNANPKSLRGRIIPNRIVVRNVFKDFYIEKFKKTDKNNCKYNMIWYEIYLKLYKNSINQNDCDMFSKDIISHLIESKWNPDGEIQISLKYLMIHELFHLILGKSGNLNSRWSDEATIEDTASKIIPTGSSKKPYEFTFDFISWMLNNKIKVDYTVGGTRIYVSSLFNYIKKEFYYKKKYSRKFNPFKTLKYKRGGYTLANYVFYTDKDSSLFADDTRCEPLFNYIIPKKDCYSDPECPGGGKVGSPGGDAADDRYSFSEGIVREYNLAPEAVIFTDGYWQDALKLYGGLKFDGDNVAEQLLEATPFLVIPTGGLFGKDQDSTFKAILEKYVNLGGTIVVFCQQYGSHVENVVPGGESLKVYGWR